MSLNEYSQTLSMERSQWIFDADQRYEREAGKRCAIVQPFRYSLVVEMCEKKYRSICVHQAKFSKYIC